MRASSSAAVDALRAGPRRLAADVDDRRAGVEHPPRRVTAGSTRKCTPPSENESGVTLITPITDGRGKRSSIGGRFDMTRILWLVDAGWRYLGAVARRLRWTIVGAVLAGLALAGRRDRGAAARPAGGRRRASSHGDQQRALVVVRWASPPSARSRRSPARARHYFAIRNRARADAAVRDGIFRRALDLDARYHDRVGAGELISRASNDAELVARLFDAIGHTIGYVPDDRRRVGRAVRDRLAARARGARAAAAAQHRLRPLLAALRRSARSVNQEELADADHARRGDDRGHPRGQGPRRRRRARRALPPPVATRSCGPRSRSPTSTPSSCRRSRRCRSSASSSCSGTAATSRCTARSRSARSRVHVLPRAARQPAAHDRPARRAPCSARSQRRAASSRCCSAEPAVVERHDAAAVPGASRRALRRRPLRATATSAPCSTGFDARDPGRHVARARRRDRLRQVDRGSAARTLLRPGRRVA